MFARWNHQQSATKVMQVHGLNFLFWGIHKEDAPIRHFWDCAIDRVEMAVMCIVGLSWGTHFQHGGKFVSRNSLTMHFGNHLEPFSRANSTGGLLLCYSWMKYLPWRIMFLLICISIWARTWVSAGNNNYGIHVVTTCQFLLWNSLMYMYY